MLRHKYPDLLPIVSVLIAATIVSAPLMLFGAPFGQDTIYHLSWLHSFNRELAAGQWYPRWLHDLNEGAGSPGFFFYAPLPFYLAAFFDRLLCTACQPTVQLGIGVWITLLLSGLAFYALAREYARRYVAALGALAYMLMPYHFEIDLWRRFDFGEFSAYICMPLVLLFLKRTLADRRYLPALAASYAGLIFSHVPSALLFSLYLGTCTLLYCWYVKSLRPLTLLATAVGLGTGLAAVYLLPALLDQTYIAAQRYYVPGYAPSRQLWNFEYFNYANWMFLDGRPERYRTFGTRLFQVLLGTTAVALLLSVPAFVRDRGRLLREFAPWLLGIAFVWFMVTPASKLLWELFADLRKIQFPWRSIMIADLATAMLFVIAAELALSSQRIESALSVAVAVPLFIALLISGARSHPGQPAYPRELVFFQTPAAIAAFDAKFAAGYDALEFHMPIWVGESADEMREALASIPQIAVPAEAGEVRVLRWADRDIGLRVRLDRDARLTVKQFYYPGWRADTVGSGVAIPLGPSARTGLVELSAPRGSYDIHLRLEPLWSERAGALLSIAAVIALSIMMLVDRRRGQRVRASVSNTGAQKTRIATPSV